MAEKLYPTQLNISMGTIEMTQLRRAAYEKAATKADANSLGAWAREILDKAAGFSEPK